MIKYTEIINRIKNSKSSKKPSEPNTLNRKGYGYMKRRMGLLSNEANQLMELQHSKDSANS